jgi:hypothetical protein
MMAFEGALRAPLSDSIARSWAKTFCSSDSWSCLTRRSDVIGAGTSLRCRLIFRERCDVPAFPQHHILRSCAACAAQASAFDDVCRHTHRPPRTASAVNSCCHMFLCHHRAQTKCCLNLTCCVAVLVRPHALSRSLFLRVPLCLSIVDFLIGVGRVLSHSPACAQTSAAH